MNIDIIAESILLEKEYTQISKTLASRHNEAAHPLLISGLADGARAVFYGALIKEQKKKTGVPALLLMPDEKDGLRTFNALSELGVKPLMYPLRDLVFHNITSSHEYENERLRAL